MRLLREFSVTLWRQRASFVHGRSNCRAFSAVAAAAETAATHPEGWDAARPYSELPGPSKLQMLRLVMPGGPLHNKSASFMFEFFRSKYGTLSKMPGMLGKQDMVMCADPKFFEHVFRTEGIWPERRGIATFVHYRKVVRPDVFKDMGGLVSDQGEKWHDLRTVANPVMLAPKTVKSYLSVIEGISREFVERMGELRDASGEMPADFNDELSQWALESVGVIALDRRLGVMDSNRDEDVTRVIEAVRDFFRLAFAMEIMPPIWKYYKTKQFHQLMSAFDVMTNYITKHIEEAMVVAHKANRATDENQTGEISVLQKLLEKDPHYAFLMTYDMIFAGIDTTSSAAATLLHRLAVNPEQQEILRKEVLQLLPESSSRITKENYAEFKYLRACMKESMRLQPQVAGNFRGTGQNIVLQGYRIPKNTDIFMTNQILQKTDEYFARSSEFLPERWLRDDSVNDLKAQHPFVYLPFGFGPRMCIGRRFAEMELVMLTAQILRQYRIEWKYEAELEYANALINNPVTELKFRLVPLA